MRFAIIPQEVVDTIKSFRSFLIGDLVTEKDAYDAIVDFFSAFVSFLLFRQIFERFALKKKKIKIDEIVIMSLGYSISRFFQSALIKRYEYKLDDVVIVNSYM